MTKRQYAKPEVVDYGKLEDVSEAGSSPTGSYDGGGMNNYVS